MDNLEIIAAVARPARRFNGAMLITAREALSLRQEDLANLVGVSQPVVARWELSKAEPDGEQVGKLSQKLHVREEFFFLDRPRRLASMSDFYHRALAKAARRDIKAVHARCNIIDIQIDRLLQIGEPDENCIPDLDPSDYADDCELIAETSRKEMRLGPGPIQNLVAAIENCGAIVIDRDLVIDDVDALCRWVPEGPRLFFLNGSKPADRIRHSLAHELGHTIMHFGRDVDHKTAEDQANSFASAFLMPANEFRRDFRGPRVSIADLAAVKRKWRVSMWSALRRAHSIGIIDKGRYRWLCIQMSKQWGRKSEPVQITGETPTAFTKLLQQHLDRGFSRSDLADILLVTEATIDKMLVDAESPTYEADGVRLRVVREDT